CAPPACASRRRARVSNRPSRKRGEVMPWSSAQMMHAPVSAGISRFRRSVLPGPGPATRRLLAGARAAGAASARRVSILRESAPRRSAAILAVARPSSGAACMVFFVELLFFAIALATLALVETYGVPPALAFVAALLAASWLGRRQYARMRPAAVAAAAAAERERREAAAFRVELLRSWKHLNRMLALGCLALGTWLALGRLGPR